MPRLKVPVLAGHKQKDRASGAALASGTVPAQVCGASMREAAGPTPRGVFGRFGSCFHSEDFVPQVSTTMLTAADGVMQPCYIIAVSCSGVAVSSAYTRPRHAACDRHLRGPRDGVRRLGDPAINRHRGGAADPQADRRHAGGLCRSAGFMRVSRPHILGTAGLWRSFPVTNISRLASLSSFAKGAWKEKRLTEITADRKKVMEEAIEDRLPRN